MRARLLTLLCAVAEQERRRRAQASQRTADEAAAARHPQSAARGRTQPDIFSAAWHPQVHFASRRVSLQVAFTRALPPFSAASYAPP